MQIFDITDYPCWSRAWSISWSIHGQFDHGYR